MPTTFDAMSLAEKKKAVSLLFRSATEGHLSVVEKLLDDGVPIDSTDSKGRGVLYYAASTNRLPIIDALAKRGINLDAQDNAGRTVLHHLVSEYKSFAEITKYIDNYHETAKHLRRLGADPSVQDQYGETILHAGVRSKRSRNIDLALVLGVNPLLQNIEGQKAADIAVSLMKGYSDYLYTKEQEYKNPPKRAAPAPQPVEPPKVVRGEREWTMSDDDEIVCVRQNSPAGYRLTETFNFKTEIYTRIAANLETRAESQVMRDFAEFSSRVAIDIAAAAYEELTGRRPAIATDSVKLNKVRLEG